MKLTFSDTQVGTAEGLAQCILRNASVPPFVLLGDVVKRQRVGVLHFTCLLFAKWKNNKNIYIIVVIYEL